MFPVIRKGFGLQAYKRHRTLLYLTLILRKREQKQKDLLNQQVSRDHKNVPFTNENVINLGTSKMTEFVFNHLKKLIKWSPEFKRVILLHS